MVGTKSQEEETENCDIKKLKTLIEALTHSGSNTLDEGLFKQVKKMCRSTQAYIPEVYSLILTQLKKKNSQIRFSAFQMCTELFNKSTVFRECVIKDLELIFKVTVGVNSKGGLPPPKSFAENLKALGIKTLQSWVNDFGDDYKQLKIAYNYLKDCKQINFENVDTRSEAERMRESQNDIRLQRLFEEKAKRIMDEVKSYESEIDETVVTLSNCLELLLPTPEDFFVQENNPVSLPNTQEPKSSTMEVENEEISHNDLRQFGITTDYSLKLEIHPDEKIKIIKTEENSSIIQNAKDCVQLINNRFFPLIKKWSQSLCKCSSENDRDLKKVLDLREKLQKILKKYKALNIENESDVKKDGDKCSSDDDDDDDDDLEEVIKEGYEDSVPFIEEELLMAPVKTSSNVPQPKELDAHTTQGSSASSSSKHKESDNLSSPSTSKEESSSTRKSKLMKIAPKLPFDIDLYHWEDEKLTTPTLVSSKIDVDKFWGCAESDDFHEIPNPEGIAALRTRVIEFTGKFEPVKWACRAPLSNGKLCPRKDRFKCPFHGKIVARDESGKCRNPEDEKGNKEPECSTVPDWQDPQLLADIKNSTGVDLKMPEKREGKKRKMTTDNLTHKKMKTSSAALKIAKSKNQPGLIDVVKRQNNAYTRLSKKLFNKSTMRRVSAALNKVDKKKFNDKFGDCFHY